MLEEIKFNPVDLSQIEQKYGHLVPKTDYEVILNQVTNTLKDINGAPWQDRIEALQRIQVLVSRKQKNYQNFLTNLNKMSTSLTN